MKKLFISMLMAIGLTTGFAVAQTSITVSNAEFTSAKATVTLSEADKTTVGEADVLLAIAAPYNSGSINPGTTSHSVGDIVYWQNSRPAPIVYADKPNLSEGNLQLELMLTTPEGLDHYLWLYTGKKSETGSWTYTQLAISSAKFQTKKPGIAISEVSNASIKATVTLNETLKTQMNESNSVVIMKGQSSGTAIKHTNDGAEYQIGDETQDEFFPMTVVYISTPPSLTTDNAFPVEINNQFNYGERGYLVLCFGKKDKENQWTYTQEVLNSSEYLTQSLEVTASEVEYATLKVSVTMDEVMKTAYNSAVSVVAFTSPNEAPIVRHDNEGAHYKVGDQVAMQYPVVFEGKPALTSDGKLEFSCTNLEPGSSFYLILCLGTETDGAVTYATNTFAKSANPTEMKSITAPTKLTVGTQVDGKLPLTIAPAEGFATMLVKSDAATSLNPKGNLKVGDTYENWVAGYAGTSQLAGTGKIAAFLPAGTTSYDLEMTPGEMAYIQAFSVVDQETDQAAYSPLMVMTPAYLQADKLPLIYTFSAKDYIQNQAYDAMPILPPGLSTGTVLPEEAEDIKKVISSAFAITRDSRDDVYYLQSSYYFDDGFDMETMEPIYTLDTSWPEVIMPAFSGVEKVQATFRTKYFTRGRMAAEAYRPEAGDSIRIEYSLNGGTWELAALFTADNLPDLDYSTYPLTVDFRCEASDVVRLRYSYRTTTAGVMTAIMSYEILEGRDCETPANLSLVADQTTDRQIQLKWDDNNVIAAGQYIVSYQKYVEPETDDNEGGIAPWSATAEGEGEATEESDVWETFSVNTNEATLRGLDAASAYIVKVQAVCGAGDSSFITNPSTLNTYNSMPYTESLASGYYDDMTMQFPTTPAGISVANGLPGQELEAADMQDAESLMRNNILPPSWSLLLSSGWMMSLESHSIAIANTADQAWLTLPGIYARKTGAFYPKTFKFKVNTYDYQAMGGGLEYGKAGIDLIDPALRLYVLASTNGQFTWNDTVASFDHTALMAQPAAGAENPAEDEETAAVTGKELTVAMDEFEGPIHIAFYFHNPNKFVMPDQGGPGGFSLRAAKDETAAVVEEPLFLEIFDLSFAYDEEPCFPVENLEAEPERTEALLSWEGEGAEYGISYGPANAEGYANTIYQTATEDAIQTLKLTDLNSNTEYKVAVVSYCTAGDREHGSIAQTATFTTLKQLFKVTVNVTPEEAGTVSGAASYFEGDNVTLTATANRGYKFTAWFEGETELSKEPTYKFQIQGNVTYTAKFEELPALTLTLIASPAEGGSVEGADEDEYYEGDSVTIKATANENYKFVAWLDGNDTVSKQATYQFLMPGENTTYTALFVSNVANEELLKASFKVGTQNGNLYVRNLNGITVKGIDVYGLTGNLVNRFTPNSREDLTLPIDAQRAILFIRLNTEQGLAVYKVYLQ